MLMNKSDCVFIRLEPDMKQVLKSSAEEKGLNVSTYCRTILLKEIKLLKNIKQATVLDSSA